MSLETVVRPYATPDNAPARAFIDASQNPDTPVRLVIGRGGGAQIFTINTEFQETFYMDQVAVEVTLATEA